MSTDRTHLMSCDMLQNVIPAGKFLLIYLVYLMIYRLDLRNKLVIFVGDERSYLCNGNVQVCQRIIMDYHGNFPLVAVPEVVKLVGQRQRTLNVSAFIYLLYLFYPPFQQIILIIQYKKRCYRVNYYQHNKRDRYFNPFQLSYPPCIQWKAPF